MNRGESNTPLKDVEKRDEEGKKQLHETNHLVDRQKPIVHAPKGEPSSLISAKNLLLYCLYSLARQPTPVNFEWLLSHAFHSINFSPLLLLT